MQTGSQQALIATGQLASSQGRDDTASVNQHLGAPARLPENFCIYLDVCSLTWITRRQRQPTTQPLEATRNSPAAGHRLKLWHVHILCTRV